MSESRARLSYHDECEAAVNKQVNLELYASYTYLSLVLVLVLITNVLVLHPTDE